MGSFIYFMPFHAFEHSHTVIIVVLFYFSAYVTGNIPVRFRSIWIDFSLIRWYWPDSFHGCNIYWNTRYCWILDYFTCWILDIFVFLKILLTFLLECSLVTWEQSDSLNLLSIIKTVLSAGLIKLFPTTEASTFWVLYPMLLIF